MSPAPGRRVPWVYRGFNRLYGTVEQGYISVVRWMVRRPRTMVCVFCVVVGLAAATFAIYPTALVPLEDQGFCIVTARLPAGASQPRVRQVSADIDAVLARWLTPRHANAHKGEHGHVLCIGGEAGMGGAVRLCAEGALRTGVGLASVATRSSGVAALVAARPEAMTHAVEDVASLMPLLERATVLAVGPGLGQGDWGRSLYRAALAADKPLVLDADALNLLADEPHAVPGAVITPHPGEAARLLGEAECGADEQGECDPDLRPVPAPFADDEV